MKFKINLLLLLTVAALAGFFSCKNDNSITDAQEDDSFIELINDLREKGCDCGGEYQEPADPLSYNDKLNQAAERHSKDMADNNFFDHTGSDGSSFADRIEDTGYSRGAAAENIGKGYNSDKEVFEGWLNSPPHCKNMMNPTVSQMGYAVEGEYRTLVLAQPR